MGVDGLVPPRSVVAVLIDGHSILHIPVLVRGGTLRGIPNGCTIPGHRSRRQVARVDAIHIIVVVFSKGAHVSLCTLPGRLSKVPKPVGHFDYIQTDLQSESGALLDGWV